MVYFFFLSFKKNIRDTVQIKKNKGDTTYQSVQTGGYLGNMYSVTKGLQSDIQLFCTLMIPKKNIST